VMKRSGGKATMGKSSMIAGRSLGKTRTRVQTTSLTKAPQVRPILTGAGQLRSRFRYQSLPFVKKLSKKNPLAARILEDSYKKGVATAATGDLGELL
jgi:hypothetical protein